MNKNIIYIGSIIFFLGALFFALYQYNITQPISSNSQTIKFEVKKGEGLKQISENLYRNHLIRAKFYFDLYIWINNLDNKLQAGVYNLDKNFNIKKIANILSQGQVINQEKEIKIIEGWNIKDINTYLKEKRIIKDDEFSRAALSPIANWNFSFDLPSFLRDVPKTANLEGFLFPDTYRIYNNASVEDVIFKMLSNFDKKVDSQMRTDILKQEKNLYEIIILASIVEKEVKSEEDMKIVAGIFWNRLKRGQPLESCATLAYILGVNKKQYSQEDTQIDSPYNTYRHKGLPPGPICNPSLQAIKAAIYPIYTDYNYFLTSSVDGKTIFSRTYQEHLKNKARYLK